MAGQNAFGTGSERLGSLGLTAISVLIPLRQLIGARGEAPEGRDAMHVGIRRRRQHLLDPARNRNRVGDAKIEIEPGKPSSRNRCSNLDRPLTKPSDGVARSDDLWFFPTDGPADLQGAAQIVERAVFKPTPIVGGGEL